MKEEFKTSIGGQALIEGVMMRGPKLTAMAVRTPDSSITVETWDNPSAKWYRKIPFVRGAFSLVSSLALGYKCLMRSAELSGEEQPEPSKLETWLSKKSGKSLMNVVSVISSLLGVGIAVVLFIMLPSAIAGLFKEWLGTGLARTVTEGVIKIAILVLYMWGISLIPDMRRVFEYHGGEHKTIACYEHGLELTVENVRPMSRFHPRCGTSFILITLIISIFVFSVFNAFVHLDNSILRMVLHFVVLLPVIGISFEIIQLAGRYDNFLTRIISAPGLWLQRITTKEPDDSQIQVAIDSMLPVIPEERGSDVW